MFLVIKSLSSPAGIDDWKASSICSEDVFEIKAKILVLDSSFEDTFSNSSRSAAGIVI
jgi:hypothetical protein